MNKYVIMGSLGAGKSTQAGLLARAYDLVHINVGEIFRWNIQNHTKMGARVRRVVASGQLVSDDLVEDVVKTRLDRHDYNLILHRPTVAGLCDICGGRLVTRPEDSAEALRRRLADFHAGTTPIFDLFRTRGLLIDVDGVKPPAEVQHEIRAQLMLPDPPCSRTEALAS